jgi:hypothetical protein
MFPFFRNVLISQGWLRGLALHQDFTWRPALFAYLLAARPSPTVKSFEEEP